MINIKLIVKFYVPVLRKVPSNSLLEIGDLKGDRRILILPLQRINVKCMVAREVKAIPLCRYF